MTTWFQHKFQAVVRPALIHDCFFIVHSFSWATTMYGITSIFIQCLWNIHDPWLKIWSDAILLFPEAALKQQECQIKNSGLKCRFLFQHYVVWDIHCDRLLFDDQGHLINQHSSRNIIYTSGIYWLIKKAILMFTAVGVNSVRFKLIGLNPQGVGSQWHLMCRNL